MDSPKNRNGDLVRDLVSENRRHGANPNGVDCSARHFKPTRLPWEREA